MSDAASTPAHTPTAEETLYCTIDADFEDVVPYVQLEHELADFETVQVTRLDEMIEGMLGEAVERTALIVVCHPEIARDALAISPTLTGMLPCTTVVYERPDDDLVHVLHVSATKAIRDLGLSTDDDAVQTLVDRTGELMDVVWENVRANSAVVEAEGQA